MKFYTILTLFIGLNFGFQAPVFAMEKWDTGDFEFDSEENQPITLSKIHQKTNQVTNLALEFDLQKYNPEKNYRDYQLLTDNIRRALPKKSTLEEAQKAIGLLWVYLKEPRDSLKKAQKPFKNISGIISIWDSQEYSTNTKFYLQMLERNKPYIDSKVFEDLEKERKETKVAFEEQEMVKKLKALAVSEPVSERSNKLEIKKPTEFDTELNFSSDEE